jgi:hypothetical protein
MFLIVNQNEIKWDDFLCLLVYFLLQFLSIFIIGSSSPQSVTHSPKHMGPILETAIQRAPLIHLQAGNIQAAVDYYR